MRFSSITAVLAAFASVVLAQQPNAFNIPPAGYLLHAGQPTTFTWSDKQGSTVTLTLRDGANGDLNQGTIIASSISNTGSYVWNVPSSIVEGNSYTIEISNDADPSQTNFTPQFDILSPNKAVASGSSTVTVTGTTASSASTAAASTTGSGTSTAASSSGSSSSGSSSASASASASSASAGAPSSASAGSAPSPTSNAGAPVLKAGGLLLAVALGFAVAL